MVLQKEMPASKIALVLLGFPFVSALVSLLLLDRSLLAWTGLDFFTAFWILITGWYALQIAILGKVLRSVGWGWSDIGYGFNRRRTLWFVGGYLFVTAALLGLVEFASAGAASDPEKVQALSDLSNLTPKTLPARLVFVFMGLAAGLCEELVYRGFAINSLRSRRLSPWLAIPIAATPFVFQHGLKSLDQFWWFAIWGVVFGVIFVFARRLYINIVLHWLVILSAVLAVLQTVR